MGNSLERDSYGLTQAGNEVLKRWWPGRVPEGGAPTFATAMRHAQADLIAAHLPHMPAEHRARAGYMLVALANAAPYPAPIDYPTEHLTTEYAE